LGGQVDDMRLPSTSAARNESGYREARVA
jgi:hypothetical protein